tara:strand:+ start:506 stop:724 length:219 start_codon:yes stop_codon:yes gene_type:complete
MERITNIRFIRTISKLILPETQSAALGRWNLKDSEEIKGELANMDCCGDDLCGTPLKYNEKITNIINSTKKN